MMKNKNLGRITESRTGLSWCRPAKKVRNLNWFNKRTFTTAKLSTGYQPNVNGTPMIPQR